MLEKDAPRLVQSASTKGTNVYYGNVPLYPVSSDPKEGTLRKIKAYFPIAPQTLIYVPSPLLFYGISELLENTDNSVHILCVEALQSFMKFSIDNVDSYIFSHDRISFVRTDSVEQILTVLRQLGVERFKRVIPMYLNRGYTFCRDTYDALNEAIAKEIRYYWENKITSIHMGHRWLKNLFLNLSSFPRSKDLSTLQVEKPVLVTGAGISLEKTCVDLRASGMKNEFYIIATDTSLPTLLSHSIYPDSVCILESQTYNLRDFIGSIPLKCAVFCDITAHPQSFYINNGRIHLFSSTFSDNALFQRMSSQGILPTQIPPLGSVGISALEIASSITEYPIFYTGLDFAFLPGKTHARGTEHHKHTLMSWNRTNPNCMYSYSVHSKSFPILDQFGNPCRSDLVLHSYAETAREKTKGKKQYFNLGNFGLPSGGISAVLREISNYKKIFPSNNPVTDPKKETGEKREKSFSPNANNCLDFLQEEKRALSQFIEFGKAFLQGSQKPHLYDELISSLKRVDFILIPFPDQERKRGPDITFIKRSLASALVYHSYINTAIQRVSTTLRLS